MRRFHLGFLDDGGDQFLVDDAVDADTQLFIRDNVAEFGLRRQLKIFLDINNDIGSLPDLSQHGQQYLRGGSILPLFFQFTLNFRNSLAFFDSSGQRFFIARGEQRHTANLVQIKADRVVTDFLILVFLYLGLRFKLQVLGAGFL